MKIKEAYSFTKMELKRLHDEREVSGIAGLIFEDFGYSSLERHKHAEQELAKMKEERLYKIILKLKQNIPVQYILGYTWFLETRIEVNSDVLIPRLETEELVDSVIRENKDTSPRILDIGTGSGCIAITLKKNIPGSFVTAMDISTKALEIAERNAKLNQVEINFIYDDILHPVRDKYSEYDVIVSNPPYVTESDRSEMPKNVLDHEPALALFVSDKNPLAFYQAIERFSSPLLKPGGQVYLEINEKYGRETGKLFNTDDYSKTELIKDMQGKDRFIKAIKGVTRGVG